MHSIALILALIPTILFGQNNDILESYLDEATELIGFKNQKGEIVIQPKFTRLFTSAKKFDNIIAVRDDSDEKFVDKSYYLLKDGTKFGYDSLYSFDFSYACESEGFIKFRDSKKDLVGFFDSKAKVTIPAEYNETSQMHNGIFLGLKNAKKECWDKDEHTDCEHWSWVEGQMQFVDSTNTVLVENYLYESELNFYTLEISEKPIINGIRDNFIGLNGKYYSFVNNEKEFKAYFDSFLKNLNFNNLLKNSYKDILFSGERITKEQFLKDYGNEILKRFEFLNLKKRNIELNINADFSFLDLSEFDEIFSKRKDNCDDLITNKYPVFEVFISFYNKRGKFLNQDHYVFTKIDNSYKLLSASITNK